jgi:DNA polymerase V
MLQLNAACWPIYKLHPVEVPAGACLIPFFLATVWAGFPSPAEDYAEELDLVQHLIQHPSATFVVRVQGTSMLNASINPGDLLIVDRSLEPRDKDVVVAVMDGEFTVKRLRKTKRGISLLAENPGFPPIEIREGMQLEIWGVVTQVIHPFRTLL